MTLSIKLFLFKILIKRRLRRCFAPDPNLVQKKTSQGIEKFCGSYEPVYEPFYAVIVIRCY